MQNWKIINQFERTKAAPRIGSLILRCFRTHSMKVPGVRVTNGNHSYEIVPVRDPATLLLSHYKVVVVSEINGIEKVIFQENAPSLERASEIGETQLRAVGSSEEPTSSSRVA